MSRRVISQREAHAAIKQAENLRNELQRQRRDWAREYVGGIHLGRLSRGHDWFAGRLEAVQRLQHAIVAKVDNEGGIDFYALPLPEKAQ